MPETLQRKAARMRAFRAKNPQLVRDRNKRSRERHPETMRSYRQENAERIRSKNADWFQVNKSHERARNAAWYAAHPAEAAAKASLRRAAAMQACPPWADHDAIAAIYRSSARVTQETGIEHHVDHYYPLKHKLFCGLHIPINLRIITAEENFKKKNNVTSGMIGVLPCT